MSSLQELYRPATYRLLPGGSVDLLLDELVVEADSGGVSGTKVVESTSVSKSPKLNSRERNKRRKGKH